MEVTTTNPDKRGLPVDPEDWKGWLYQGGHAVLCDAHVSSSFTFSYTIKCIFCLSLPKFERAPPEIFTL